MLTQHELSKSSMQTESVYDIWASDHGNNLCESKLSDNENALEDKKLDEAFAGLKPKRSARTVLPPVPVFSSHPKHVSDGVDFSYASPSYPHSGQSINPDPVEHEKALQLAVAMLSKKEEKQKRVLARIRGADLKKSTNDARPVESPILEEIANDESLQNVNSRRKTKKERRLHRERKIHLSMASKQQTRQRVLEKDIQNIEKYKKEIENKIKAREAPRGLPQRNRKYGKHAVLRRAMDILPEAPECLRDASGGSTHPLEEMYERAQCQGRVEATRKHTAKTRRVSRSRWVWVSDDKHHVTRQGPAATDEGSRKRKR